MTFAVGRSLVGTTGTLTISQCINCGGRWCFLNVDGFQPIGINVVDLGDCTIDCSILCIQLNVVILKLNIPGTGSAGNLGST